MAKKRCLFCRQWFSPYVPQAARQQICGRLSCKRQLKRTLDRAWVRQRDFIWRRKRRGRVRAWAAKRNYWPWYRKENPAYAARDNKRRARSLRRQRWGCSAKQER
jgi:hypothetical protein